MGRLLGNTIASFSPLHLFRGKLGFGDVNISDSVLPGNGIFSTIDADIYSFVNFRFPEFNHLVNRKSIGNNEFHPLHLSAIYSTTLLQVSTGRKEINWPLTYITNHDCGIAISDNHAVPLLTPELINHFTDNGRIPIQNTCVSDNLFFFFTSPVKVFDKFIELTRVPITRDFFTQLTAVQVLGKKYIQNEWGNPFDEKVTPNKPKDPSVGIKILSSTEEKHEVQGLESKSRQYWAPSFFDMIWPWLLPLPSWENSFEEFIPKGKQIRPYQMIGIEKLTSNRTFLLADEMGTGKTVIAVTAMRILFRQLKIRNALILCPVSVLQVWEDHLFEWGMCDLTFAKVRGSQIQRKQIWGIGYHVYITSYDTYRSDFLAGQIKNKFDLIILDEAQYLKNQHNNRFRAMSKSKKDWIWALTGTPLENSVEDVKSIFEILKPGLIAQEIKEPGIIQDAIKPYMLRRLKTEVLKDLPIKTNQEIWLELTTEQREEYDRVYKYGVQNLQELTKQNKISKPHIFSLIMKLKQICNFPSSSFKSNKANAMIEIIENLQSESKIVIFSQFISEGVQKISEVINKYPHAVLVGSQNEGIRQREINKFRHEPKTKILLASIKAGGIGITLTESNFIIHFDHWWNPATMRQAEDRVHRFGQKNPVTVYEFWMENTIEERIKKLLQEKSSLAAQVIDGLAVSVSLEEKIYDSITTEEWLEKIFNIEPSGIIREQLKKEINKPYAEDSHPNNFEMNRRILKTSPVEFERFVGEIIRHMGYPHVQHKGKTNDGGVDLLAWRETQNSREIIFIQCKRYTDKKVGVSIIRDLRGAVSQSSNIAKGFLITTSEFTEQSRRFAAESDGKIELINGAQLTNYAIRYEIYP